MEEIERTNMDIHNSENGIFESEKHSSKQLEQSKTHRCECIISARCNNPMFVPSYEMPTLASRLKRSNRSYFNRLNSQNIPFVVGTSATPSYNLGINIQQVLSLIKMRQSNTNSITPLLIRRGTKTMSVLLKQMNRQYEKSVLRPISQIMKTHNNMGNLNISQGMKLSAEEVRDICTPDFEKPEMISERSNKICEQFYKERNNLYENNKINYYKQLLSSVANKNDLAANMENMQAQKISGILLNKKDNNGDGTMHIASSYNFMAIRNVLINLHDQFEEMNMKYEELQLKMQKSNNKTLAKQLSILEKRLNMKEEEINVVITLYKKIIMSKSSREKNNLICTLIHPTNSSTKYHQNSFPILDVSEKSCLTNITQVFDQKEGNVHDRIIQEPLISMQLAALLRQIQSFYKQLQLIS